MARAARSLISALVADLGGDPSTAELQLATRAALTGAIINDFETRWAAGEQIDLPNYLSAVNVQRRVLATIGLKRVPREIGSTIGGLMRQAALEPPQYEPEPKR